MSAVWAFIVWVRRLSADGLGRLFKRYLFAREELRAARETGMEGEQRQMPEEGTELFLNRGKHVGRAEAGQVGSPPGWGPRREALMRSGSALCPGGRLLEFFWRMFKR